MAPKKKTEVISQDEFEAALKSEPQVFDAVTLGIVKTETGYSILKVSVDSKGLEAGEVEVIDTADSRAEANEKFKINVIKLRVM